MGFSSLLVGLVLAAFDNFMYGEPCLAAPWRCVAPLNALRYNLSPRNLATHGLHPRLTHALLNAPLLYGPLAAVAARDVLRSRCGLLRGSYRLKHVWPPSGQPFTLRKLLVATAVTPLAALSLIPHQEARFLIPLLLPLVLLYGPLMLRSRVSLGSWAAFHGLLTLFFGGAHQAGVVPALAHLQRLHRLEHHPPRAAVVVFAHTYTPPRSLLGRRLHLEDDPPGSLDLVALPSSTGPCEILAAIEGAFARDGAPQVYAALPAATARAVRSAAEGPTSCKTKRRPFAPFRPPLRLALETRFWPHWSGEEPPRTLGDATLEVYRVSRQRRTGTRSRTTPWGTTPSRIPPPPGSIHNDNPELYTTSAC